MTLIFLVWWTFPSVKVVDMNSIAEISSSEHMTSITELNFPTALDLNVLGNSQLFGKNIVDNDLFLNCDDHMEPTWMESYS